METLDPINGVQWPQGKQPEPEKAKGSPSVVAGRIPLDCVLDAARRGMVKEIYNIIQK
jgi:hypothetical protein